MNVLKRGVSKHWLAILVFGWLTAGAAQAGLVLVPDGAIGGKPGGAVGWGFSLASDPVNDGGVTITPWMVINSADFVLDPGVFPVGVFTPFIANAFQVVGPDTGNGEVNPWSQTFDDLQQTGIGAYLINSFQSPGDTATGRIVLTYDLCRVSPDSADFNPITDTIANGLTLSAPASVVVTPEPSAWALFVWGGGVGALGWFRRRRRATLL